MSFEWDPAKAASNLEKHGVDFSEAIRIFETETTEVLDDRKPYGETRWLVVGKLESLVMVVVYTWRGNQRRIISARLANQRERSRYYGQD